MRCSAHLILWLCLYSQTAASLRKPNKRNETRTVKKCFGDICEIPTKKYPLAKITRILARHKKLYKKLRGVVIEPKTVEGSSPVIEENLCTSKRSKIYPKYSRREKWIIVNVPNFSQSVTVEMCRNGGKCANVLLHKYNFFCKQLYQTVPLLYVGKKNQLKFRPFRLPNTCVCTLKKY